MSTSILTSLDFNHLELLNVRWQNLGTAPSSPAAGWTYYDTSDDTFRGWDGSSWIDLGASGGGGGTVTSVSVVSANGFGGSVATATTTPAITLTTNVTGLLLGNGTGVSAATASDIPTPLTTKGDLLAYSTTPVRLSVGTNKQVLNADSAATPGVAWVSMDHTYISDFDTQVRTSTLNQMASPTADLSINSHKLTSVSDPTSAQDAATKAYVDSGATGIVRKYTTLIGNGSSTSLVVTHSLGTKDITWSIREAATDDFVLCDVEATSTTTATFSFATAPSSNQYKVVVHG